MSSSNHTLPPLSISDVMKLLYRMEKQNEEILAKLNSIEDDNRKLRQELHEIKSYQKFNHHNSDKISSKRDETEEDESENKNGQSNKKKSRVSVSSLPEPKPSASFDTLDDDCLGNVLDFVGKKCYSAFGRVNKRCNKTFCLKGLPKVTYIFGYAPLQLIQQKGGWYYSDIAKGVLYYNRRDILDWILSDEIYVGYIKLIWLCYKAIEESSVRLDILREVFQRVNERQLEYLRDGDIRIDLCGTAAQFGKLECLEFLRLNRCRWDDSTWKVAKRKGHDHILEYMRSNGYPTEWQN